ncbi:cystatin-C-like [Cavia porcellus]|uniref:cystatin-C-like n=1 Tax=Cavia porcellus TaxID=10141 RepID=UPI002FE1C7F4
MASSLRVPVLLLAVLVLSLAMTPMALKSVKKWLRLMGELEEGNVSDEEVQYVVDFAIQEYNRANAEPNLYRVARIVRVQQQVAMGMRYYLDLEIGSTICSKDQAMEDDCPFSKTLV